MLNKRVRKWALVNVWSALFGDHFEKIKVRGFEDQRSGFGNQRCGLISESGFGNQRCGLRISESGLRIGLLRWLKTSVRVQNSI